jgi:hypothetical protein
MKNISSIISGQNGLSLSQTPSKPVPYKMLENGIGLTKPIPNKHTA